MYCFGLAVYFESKATALVVMLDRRRSNPYHRSPASIGVALPSRVAGRRAFPCRIFRF